MDRRTLLAGGAGLALLPVAGQKAEAAGPMMAVGNRCGCAAFGFVGGTDVWPYRWVVSRIAHVMPAAARDMQLVFGNFAYSAVDREAPGPNAITVRAELEYTAGQPIPLRFDGREQIRIAGGAFAVTDPVDLRLPAGARFRIRTTVTVDEAPFRWPQNILPSQKAGDICFIGTDPATMNAAVQRPDLADPRWLGYGPYNIIGRPERPNVAVAILGDSVVSGGGADDAFGNRGFVQRALNSQVAWCDFASAGDGLRRFLAQNSLQRTLIGQHFSHAICALGIDEIRAGDEAGIRESFEAVWNVLTGMGLKLFQTTITTHTTSIDNWTTAEGQTIANPNFLPGGVYHRINEWLRTVPAPLSGIFDPAALLETGLDSGLWITPNRQAVTADGPHLNALGIEIAAKSIDVGRLTQ